MLLMKTVDGKHCVQCIANNCLYLSNSMWFGIWLVECALYLRHTCWCILVSCCSKKPRHQSNQGREKQEKEGTRTSSPWLRLERLYQNPSNRKTIVLENKDSERGWNRERKWGDDDGDFMAVLRHEKENAFSLATLWCNDGTIVPVM